MIATESQNVTVSNNSTASANFTNTAACKGEIEIRKFEGRGCTPGYWKNHLADWPPTGYDPSETVSSVFNVPVCVDELGGDTLLEALEYDGGDGTVGAARILLRAGVAAVLNAAHPDVNYPHTVGEVISDVNNALGSCDRDTMLSLATELDRDNNLWCPLGQQPDGQKLLGGACFNITPNPYDGPDPLKVCDNDGTYDADSSNGTIRLENVPCGNYSITEVTAPQGYLIVTGSQNVTVTDNQTATADFTDSKGCSGCLKICKYEDKNGNGNHTAGEPWLLGWSFNISGPDGYFETVTTGDGQLSDGGLGCGECDYCVTICDLTPGEYNVTEVTPLPEGWTNTDPGGDPPYVKPVVVLCGETSTVEFGNQQECTGCLKICKYEDKNGNGKRDYGEPYLSGWNFTVTDSQGNSWNVTTGNGQLSDGGLGCGECDYCVTICDLIPGEYNVTEVTPLPEGWTNTDPGGDPPYVKPVVVLCGETSTVEFGNQQECTGCLKICKYEDKNGNGKRDYGEPYLSGWNFTVTDSQGNSWNVTTGNGQLSDSGLGCGECDYCVTICDLTPGEYSVTEVTPLPEGWTNTDPGDGSLKKMVTVECGKTSTVEFGNQGPCSGCLKIYKYEDRDGDHQKDYGEPYLSGWEFTVTDSQGNSWSGTTNRDGYVTICDLATGQYNVTETQKDGWTNTDPGDGSLKKTVTVECGRTTTVKFGNQRPCSGCLKIYKYEDKNGNGRKDWGEPYLSGWEFTVIDSQGNSWSGTTNRDGYVKICALVPGQYNVTETSKYGWTNTDPRGTPPSKLVEVRCGSTTTVKFGNQREYRPPCANATSESPNSTLTEALGEGDMSSVTNTTNTTGEMSAGYGSHQGS